MHMHIYSWFDETIQKDGKSIEIYKYAFGNGVKKKVPLGEFRQMFETGEDGICRPAGMELYSNRGLIATFAESARLSDEVIKVLLCL